MNKIVQLVISRDNGNEIILGLSEEGKVYRLFLQTHVGEAAHWLHVIDSPANTKEGKQ